MNLSLTAYSALQRLRRAYVEAGEDGYCKETYFDGSRRCLLGRAAELTGIPMDLTSTCAMFQFHLRDPNVLEWNKASCAVAGDTLPNLNDICGFAGTVAVLDRMLAECAPVDAPVLEEAVT